MAGCRISLDNRTGVVQLYGGTYRTRWLSPSVSLGNRYRWWSAWHRHWLDLVSLARRCPLRRSFLHQIFIRSLYNHEAKFNTARYNETINSRTSWKVKTFGERRNYYDGWRHVRYARFRVDRSDRRDLQPGDHCWDRDPDRLGSQTLYQRQFPVRRQHADTA